MEKKYTHFLLSIFTANLLFFISLQSASAQLAGDYRTVASGAWNAVATWETYDGLAWVAATTSPTVTDGQINIQLGHNVNVSSNETIDQTLVDGSLTIDTGAMLTIEDDGTAANDLDLIGVGTMTVNGTLRKNQGANISSTAATMSVNAGGTYEHNNTTTIGNLPLATWDAASNCVFIGYAGTVGGIFAANNFAQSFGNFTWNCPNQTSNINLAGNLTVVNGTFHVVSTGTGQLRLCGATSPNLTIAGDFILDAGELVMTNGTGLPVINLQGNYTHSGGSFLCNGTAGNAGVFNFVKNGIQQVTINPTTTLLGEIQFFVKNSGGFGPSTLEFMDNVSKFDNTAVSDFTLESGTKIIILHPDGIAASGTTGCVQVGGTRTFAQDANYTYKGTQAQVTGTGLPATLNATLEIYNFSPLTGTGVSLSQATFMTGASATLLLNLGKLSTSIGNLLSIDSDVTLSGGSATSYIEGPLKRFTNSTSAWFFPMGEGIYYKPMELYPQSAAAADFTVAAHHQTPPSNTNVGGASNVDVCSVSGLEYWEITGSAPAQIELYWHNYSGVNETAQATCPNLVVSHLNAATNLWESIGNTQIDFTQDFIISNYTGNYTTANHTFGFLCTVQATATSVAQPFCGLTNGAINVTTTNGSGTYTYSWYDGANTEDRTNLGAGTYTLVVTDGGCTDTLNVTLNPSVGVSATAIPTQPNCGASNGAIDVTVTGGTGTLNYSWSNGATTEDISGLNAGTYIFLVTDSNSCADTLVTTLNNIGGVNAVNDTITVCPNASNLVISVLSNDTGSILTNSVQIITPPAIGTGTATVNANGTITFNPGASLGAFTAFTYQITDASACTDIAMVIVQNGLPTLPTISASGSLNICQGNSVTLTSSVATGNLWFPSGQTSQSITVSAAGNYSVTVTAPNGCTATSAVVTVTVSSGAASPTVAVSGPLNFCQGDSVTLTSSIASGITWSPGGQTTAAITVYNSGTYTVTIGSAGCGGTSSPVNVNVLPTPAIPTISTSGTTTFCQGGNVILTSSAASGNSWLPGVQTTQAITVNTSGTYSVTTTNASGCSATSAPLTVTVNPSPAIPVIVPVGAVSFCAGDSVTLTTNAAVTLSWSSGQNTPTITVSNAGNYSVTSTNANGCSATSAITNVTVNPLPTTPVITPSSATTFCQGGNVVLNSSYLSGNTWSNLATSAAITVAASGNYTVTFTDANGCVATSAPTAVVVNPAPAIPLITTSGATTICSGTSVTLSSNVATGNLWSNGDTTQSITVNTAGTYTVTVSSNGCTSTSASTVVTVNPSPAPPVITSFGGTTFCEGGSVTLISSASSNNLWNTGQNTQAIVIDTSGSFTVTYTDVLGCTATSAPMIVTVNPTPQAPAILASGPLAICAGGSVDLMSSATAGNQWSNGATSQTITVTAAGNYSVFVSDTNGCTSPTTTTTVSILPALAANAFTIADAGCGNATGSVSVNAIGGSGAFNYVWSTNPPQVAQTATGLVAGTYIVTVSDANNPSCSTTAMTTVQGGIAPSIVIAPSGNITICEDKTIPLTAFGAASYIWLKDGNAIGNGSLLQANQAGTYQVVGFSGFNATGCSDTSVSVVLTVIDKPFVDIVPIGPTEVCYEHLAILTAQATNATAYMWLLENQNINNFTDSISTGVTGNYSVVATNTCGSDTSSVVFVNVHSKPDADFVYMPEPAYINAPIQFKDKSVTAVDWLWDFADGLGSSSFQNPVYTYSVADTYQVMMVIHDDIGCVDTVVKPVVVLSTDVNAIGSIFVPNTFTPNNDLAHDVFEIQYNSIKLADLQIFDRWGNKVFETNSTSEYWNGGRKNNLSHPCEDGTYYYIITGKDSKDNKFVRKGHILLMR